MKRMMLFAALLAALGAWADSEYTTLDIVTDTLEAEAIRFECRAEVESVLAIENEKIRFEGGRLAESVTWSNDVTHLVVNTVYVPSGVTLTLAEDTVLKFCGDTGIKVEDGGALSIVGANGADVILTLVNDNRYGETVDVEWTDVVSKGVWLQSSAASVVDNTYMQFYGVPFALLPNVALSDVSTVRSDGVVRVPVSISGASRSQAFSVEWIAETNDVTFASGTVSWGSSSEGNKTIEIAYGTDFSGDSFTVAITTNRACSAVTATAMVSVGDYTTLDFASDAVESGTFRIETRTTYPGRLVRGVEKIGEPDGSVVTDWDTALEADGVKTLTRDEASVEMVICNDANVAIEGGRLAANMEWTRDATHVVRNIVYVPSGVTLTVSAGAVVKFCEGTFIKVEDGGALVVSGADGEDVVFTASNDATVGAALPGTDGAAVSFRGIVLQSGAAAFSDNTYFQTRGFTYGAYPSVSVSDTMAFRSIGYAYIPFTVSGSRSQAFSIEWRAVDGTAKFGTDYTLASGTISWTGTSQGTKTLQLPLVTDRIAGETTSFRIEISVNRCVNIADGDATIEIRELDTLPLVADTVESSAVRLDNREGFAGALNRGVVTLGTPDGASTTIWDTTAEEDGWVEVTSGEDVKELAVLNDAAIAIEGGRLAGDTLWESNVTHLVRNTVYVPRGVTLTVTTNAVVKFCDATTIRVEDGGCLRLIGDAGGDVIFTAADDDTAGAVVTGVDEAGEEIEYTSVVLQSSAASYSDNGYVQMRGTTFASYPTITIHGATVSRTEGKAYLALTLSGASRSAGFGIEWKATDGTAAAGRDYLLASGSVEWTSTSQGTKWIEIPIAADLVSGERRSFEVEITAARTANLANKKATVEICEYTDAGISGEVALATSDESAAAAIDASAGQQWLATKDSETIRMSGRWQSETSAAGTTVKLSVVTPSGETLLAETSGEDERAYEWDLSQYPVGHYVLKHETVEDATGDVVETLTRRFDIVDPETTVVHGGALTASETWEAGKVHIVSLPVTVSAAYALFIEPGAVVKFLPGAGITIEDGGLMNADGLIFTHINDDSAGGDTLNDGDTLPAMDEYYLDGEFVFGVDTEIRYLTQETALTGTISERRILFRGSAYKVTGTLTVADGGDLVIPAGTVLKMESGATVAVNSGGRLTAVGTAAQPIAIVSVKDDTYGGDTNGDGDATAPAAGDWGTFKNNGGTMEFAHVTVRHGGGNTASVWNYSGETTLESCTVEAGGTLLRANGGSLVASNTILRDGTYGFYGSDVIFVNGMIIGCDTGSAYGTAANSIYLGCDVNQQSGSAVACVAWGGSASVLSGCLYVDPKFVDMEAGDYRLTAGSPCIDAGENAYVASSLDRAGDRRIQNAVVNIGCFETSASWWLGMTRRYVDAAAAPGGDGLTEETAFTRIQDAVDCLAACDEGLFVLVKPGVYGPFSVTNGFATAVAAYGDEAVVVDGGETGRCAVVTAQTRLVGLTFERGWTDGDGGAVKGGVLEHCVIRDSLACGAGGGVFGATLRDCFVIGNVSTNGGGGAAVCRVVGSTFVDNWTYATGGGMSGGSVVNSILWGNGAKEGDGEVGGGAMVTFSCVGDTNEVFTANGNITNAPQFVSKELGDYRLRDYSPCVGAGDVNAVATEEDLAGAARVTGSRTSMGAYEGGYALRVVRVTGVVGDATVSPRMQIVEVGGTAGIATGGQSGSRPASRVVTNGVFMTEIPYPFEIRNVMTDISVAFNFHDGPIYVDKAASGSSDGYSWNGAFAEIQDAVDLAADGDVILVADGTYGPVIATNKTIEIRSLNGYANAVVSGGGTARAAWLGAGVEMIGFTLTGGAADFGAGVRGGTLVSCALTGNAATQDGGGAFESVLHSCLVTGNNAGGYGGGACATLVYNGTFADNTAGTAGGGVADCDGVWNTILWNNKAGGSVADASNTRLVTSRYGVAADDCEMSGCVTAEPSFRNAAGGDYRLVSAEDSPFIGTGMWEAGAMKRVDITGLSRVRNGGIDLGCFEYTSGVTEIPVDGTAVPYAWIESAELVGLGAYDVDYTNAIVGAYSRNLKNPSAQTDAARYHTVVESYIMGLDPKDEDDAFIAHIEMVDGAPVISWTPDLNADAYTEQRKYTVLGAEDLSGGWTDMGTVQDEDMSFYRFFKVKVEMK